LDISLGELGLPALNAEKISNSHQVGKGSRADLSHRTLRLDAE
jgi:hypothetical protein